MFTMKREGRFRRKSTTQARRRPRAFLRPAAASTTSRWGWLKAQRAAFVSFILTNETAPDVEMLTAGLPLRSSGRYHESSLVGYVMTSLQVFYEGRVQGVGFRWTVRHIAKGFDIIGWVRNLIDGRVEMQVSGQENEVHAFINAIGQSELRSYIRKMTEDKLQTPVEANGFEIRHDY